MVKSHFSFPNLDSSFIPPNFFTYLYESFTSNVQHEQIHESFHNLFLFLFESKTIFFVKNYLAEEFISYFWLFCLMKEENSFA